jgi:predicted nucleic acid-binding protein
VSVLVDTSVWSLALRRDVVAAAPEVVALRDALLGAAQVFTTGLIVQELLQGFAGPRARADLIERLSALAFLKPDRVDHIEAADVRNACRRHGVQVGTIDALLIQLCRRHDLLLLSADHDFQAAAKHVEFRLWAANRGR